MPPEVRFRGPLLYRREGNVLSQVLIPNANRPIFSDGGVRGMHPDGTEAKPHFAGLLIMENKKEIFRTMLEGKIVTLSDGVKATTATNAKLYSVPITKVANYDSTGGDMTLLSRNDSNFWTRVATIINFAGGDIVFSGDGNATFRVDVPVQPFDTAQKISLMPVWTAGASSKGVLIEIFDQNEISESRILLKDGQVAYMFNWHPQWPTEEGLSKFPTPDLRADEYEDKDFKWLYQLFDPPTKNYTTWLALKKISHLRVPITRYVEMDGSSSPSPGSSGCGGADCCF